MLLLSGFNMFISKKAKLRLYKEDVGLVSKTFGCRRFVWNQLLGFYTDQYEKWKEDKSLEKPKISISSFREEFKQIKLEYPWLGEVSSIVLYETIADLYNAFRVSLRAVKVTLNLNLNEGCNLFV